MDYLTTPSRVQMFHGGRVTNSPLRNANTGYYSDGGAAAPIDAGLGALTGAMQPGDSPYVDHGTGAGGRADNIDAKLSENEYVFDAETVALLGDGNPDEGARKLDEMRANIRAHKGAALAKGEISPDAGNALEYCSGGYTSYQGGR